MAFKTLVADKVNSTFWWIIYLDPNNPANNPQIREMHGYSKFQYQNEANDKQSLLMAKCEMFAKNGYLTKCKRIEIYKKVGTLPNKTVDTLILTLFPNDYIIPPDVRNYPQQVLEYLPKFYGAINQNRAFKGLRPLPERTRINKDSLYDITKHKFKTHLELYKWCSDQICKGEAPGIVNEFLRKYSLQLQQ